VRHALAIVPVINQERNKAQKCLKKRQDVEHFGTDDKANNAAPHAIDLTPKGPVLGTRPHLHQEVNASCNKHTVHLKVVDVEGIKAAACGHEVLYSKIH